MHVDKGNKRDEEIMDNFGVKDKTLKGQMLVVENDGNGFVKHVSTKNQN